MKLLFSFLITQFCCVYTAVILNGGCQNPCIKQRTCQVNQISGKCYYIFKDKERSWSENKDLCLANNLTMVQITKEDIKNGLSLPNDLTDQEYVWLGGRANDLPSWMFSNGVLLDKTHFSKPPDFQDGQELDHCGTVTDGLIIDKTDCRNKNHFICRLDDWQSVPNIYLSEASVTWFEARARCNDMGGDIFYLNQNEDGRFLEYKLDPSKQRTFFIGLSTTYWQWENTEQIRHFNWMSGDPNDFSEKCLAMYAKDGLWVDRDCNLKMHGLCQGASTIVRPTGMPPPELEGNQNAGLKAALAIFIVSTILLAAAVIFMKRDRLLKEYRKIRPQPIEPNTLSDKQGSEPEEEKFLSEDDHKPKKEDKKLQTEVKQKDKQIKELQSEVKQKDQQINELSRQVLLLTEEKKNQFEKLKGRTDQQTKWLQNENEQLEEELKRQELKLDDAVTKLQTESANHIAKQKKAHELELKKKIDASQVEIANLKSNKDIHTKRMQEEYQQKKDTIREDFDEQIQTFKTNEGKMESKEYQRKLQQLENEKIHKVNEHKRSKKDLKSKESWDQYVKEKKSEIEQELEKMKLNHAEEIKVLKEKCEENIKQTKEQHEKWKRSIEIRMKDNKDQIENLEKELGNKNEKKTRQGYNKQPIEKLEMESGTQI